jgi:tetratricopeptide (TPR) repeat protein
MAKKKRKTLLKKNRQGIRNVEYEITSEPISAGFYESLPENVKNAVERLYRECEEEPDEAIHELLVWLEKYPNLPVLYNYLGVSYGRTGQREKAQEIIEENYRRNPDYLFARLNYAQSCLNKQDYGKIPEIFDHKFDLKLLYPKRNKFHISEVAHFMGIVGIYFVSTGERETAERYLKILRQIAPEYPMTRLLERKLTPNFIKQFLHSILSKRV